MNKKVIAVAGTAFLAGAIVISPLSSIAEQVYNRLTINQAADIMKENDLQTELTLQDDDLENMRIAFTPRDGYTPPGDGNQNSSSWTAAYRTQVEPLRRQAETLQEDYQKLSSELQREAGSYAQLYNYWIMKDQLKISEENLNLAKSELAKAEKSHKVGVISEHDLLQVKSSVNEAQISFDEAQLGYNELKYQINQKLDQRITQDVEIVPNELQFLPDAQLNINNVKKELANSHPSLGYAKKELEAYKKAHEVVTAEDFKVGNATLPIYLEREVDYWSLRLKQQQQQLDMSAHTTVEKLQQSKKAITMNEQNVKEGERAYNMALTQFEQGTTTFTDVDQARLKLYSTKLELSSAKKDYMEQKEMFRLLKEGFLQQS